MSLRDKLNKVVEDTLILFKTEIILHFINLILAMDLLHYFKHNRSLWLGLIEKSIKKIAGELTLEVVVILVLSLMLIKVMEFVIPVAIGGLAWRLNPEHDEEPSSYISERELELFLFKFDNAFIKQRYEEEKQKAAAAFKKMTLLSCALVLLLAGFIHGELVQYIFNYNKVIFIFIAAVLTASGFGSFSYFREFKRGYNLDSAIVNQVRSSISPAA